MSERGESPSDGTDSASNDVALQLAEQLSAILVQSVEPLRQLQKTMNQFARAMQPSIVNLPSAIQASLKPQLAFAQVFEPLIRENRIVAGFDRTGWLPHTAVPDSVIEESLDLSTEEASRLIESYVNTNWPSIADQFWDGFERSALDQQGFDTMREGLEARSYGLHRSVCRTVFPEIERFAKIRMPNVVIHTSITPVRSAMPERLYADEIGGLRGWSVAEKIIESCYAQVDSKNRESFQEVPNRHASIHGNIDYSSPRDSMNVLVIAAYMFGVISLLADRMSASEKSAQQPKKPHPPFT